MTGPVGNSESYALHNSNSEFRTCFVFFLALTLILCDFFEDICDWETFLLGDICDKCQELILVRASQRRLCAESVISSAQTLSNFLLTNLNVD